MFSLLAIGCKEYLTKTHHSEQSSREREEKSSSVACPIIRSNKAARRDQMQQAFQLLKSGRSSNEYKKRRMNMSMTVKRALRKCHQV